MKTRRAVLGLMLAWAGAATAQAPEEFSVVYQNDGGELAILGGANETRVHYAGSFPQGQSVGTCDCRLVLQKADASQWTLKDTESDGTLTLRMEPRQVTLSGGSPECCGAGWPGDVFLKPRLKSLTACTVKAPRAYFHDSDAQHTQRKAYVVAGDSVQAYVPSAGEEFLPARFAGPKGATVGLLRREQLDCQTKGREDLKPLAGKWVQVVRKGKGFVIEQYCDSNVPSLSLRTTGVMNVDYGQDDEDVDVTAAKPGAAGAYSLEVKWSGGQRETLAWKVVDAKRGIIQLRGGTQYFSKGALYVREDKKAAIPVRAEKCEEDE
jgi:hypothetical protein